MTHQGPVIDATSDSDSTRISFMFRSSLVVSPIVSSMVMYALATVPVLRLSSR